jgi:biotin carboxyl carrier protein
MPPVSSLVVCLILLASGCREKSEDDEAAQAAPVRVNERGQVVLTKAERTALDLQVAAAQPGKLLQRALRFGKATARPEEQSIVVAPVTARLAAPPSVALGAPVSEGAVLAMIEPLPDSGSRAGLGAQRRDLQGQFEGAQARVRALESEVHRVQTLAASQLATDADLARARAELQAEEARRDGLRRAGGELATMTGGSLAIRAPAAGVVAALASNVGALLAQGEVLARILRPGPRFIDVAAAPNDEIGTSYRVQTPGGWVSARLLGQGALVQPDGTRPDRIEVAPPDAGRLLPGATVAVEVIREIEGVVLPEDAVVLRGSQPVVFTEAAEGCYAAREIQPGPREAGRVRVLGVQPGERIVTRGAMALLGELEQSAESQRARPGR